MHGFPSKAERIDNQKKIFDCFTFFNEFELLEIRLIELYSKVDFFVLCESTMTFQGKEKPLYFESNKERFSQYLDKIIHVVVDDMPTAALDGASSGADDNWNREFFQRNAIRRGLSSARNNDIIIVSDCDEIIRASTIDFLRERDGYFMIGMPMYQFFINMRAAEGGWTKPFAYSYFLSDRIPDYNLHRLHEFAAYEKFSDANHYLDGGGWHFTFLGGMQRVADKINAYSHTDGWHGQLRDERILAEQMLALREVGGKRMLEFCNVDETFPKAIQRNLQHYINIGMIKNEFARISELERLFRELEARSVTIKNNYEKTIKELGVLKRATRTIAASRPEIASVLPNNVFNLLRSSCDFAIEWSRGAQSKAPTLYAAEDIPEWAKGNAIMCHPCDGAAITPDTNVGYYRVGSVAPRHIYTVSCWIWLPKDFPGSSVELSIGEWTGQTKIKIKTEKRMCWQKISATGAPPDSTDGCCSVLRVFSNTPCHVYSTCWQLEESDTPTDYRETFPLNLLRSSCDFTVEWSSGAQIEAPARYAAKDIPERAKGNAVMRHPCDGAHTTPDTNVGYYRSQLRCPRTHLHSFLLDMAAERFSWFVCRTLDWGMGRPDED